MRPNRVPGPGCVNHDNPNRPARLARPTTSSSASHGKYLLRCSDPTLSAEDIALGYKQLLQVERGWRDIGVVADKLPIPNPRPVDRDHVADILRAAFG